MIPQLLNESWCNHTVKVMPGRPEELHHQPTTEPYVNLSIYTARPSHSLAISR